MSENELKMNENCKIPTYLGWSWRWLCIFLFWFFTLLHLEMICRDWRLLGRTPRVFSYILIGIGLQWHCWRLPVGMYRCVCTIKTVWRNAERPAIWSTTPAHGSVLLNPTGAAAEGPGQGPTAGGQSSAGQWSTGPGRVMQTMIHGTWHCRADSSKMQQHLDIHRPGQGCGFWCPCLCRDAMRLCM